MIYVYNNSGKILTRALAPLQEVRIVHPLENIIELPENVDDSLYYIFDSNLVEKPPKPSEYHVFNYSTKQWEDPRTIDSQWEVIRMKRNQLLQATDWTQLADIPQETKTLWEPYRQALRDITSQSDPFNITWPVPPQG